MGAARATGRVHKEDVLLPNDAPVLAAMISVASGVLAIVLQVAWSTEHDCGNRYCRHVARKEEDDLDWRRP